ncbi:MAG: 2-oxo acid dehydrogenase subunit E2 [Oligoflexia bacterium]|nr:2-oxo acid dehydrogenase subunit E2 [Oligoflexia bacterium]MBF0364891.1 2-oxo acid dehydrogenase subunit E2 [Oligoflexia bacterium]
MEVTLTCPALGEHIASAHIIKVLVKEGDLLKLEQSVVEVESEKAAAEVPSTVEGTIKKIFVKSGDVVKVGDPLLLVASEVATKVVSEVAKVAEKLPPQKFAHTHAPMVVTLPKEVLQSQHSIATAAAPSVRRFAREIGIDLKFVTGSGVQGRISIEDVKSYAKNIHQGTSQGTPQGGIKETLPDFSKWGEITTEPMSAIRKKTAEHLSYAWSTIPTVTQFDKADITQLEQWRSVTITTLLIKVLAAALKQFPKFNTSIDMDKNTIISKKFYNVGVAVDTDRGLLVPVIKGVDQKNLATIASELQELSTKAKERKLSMEEMQGGCITISNLGGVGGTHFTPIIHSPEVAILGVCRSEMQSVYVQSEGKFVARLMLPLSLSYDHRVIDGVEGIRFLRWIISALENPLLLL